MREGAILPQIQRPRTARMPFALGGGKRVFKQFASDPAVVRARTHADVNINVSAFQLLGQVHPSGRAKRRRIPGASRLM